MTRFRHGGEGVAWTPGPWVVGNGGYSHGAEFEVRSADENDIYITGVQWASPGDPEEGTMPNMSQARADAFLMAAAPDLLAALQSLLALVEYIDLPTGEKGSAARDAAHFAIAKATGQ